MQQTQQTEADIVTIVVSSLPTHELADLRDGWTARLDLLTRAHAGAEQVLRCSDRRVAEKHSGLCRLGEYREVTGLYGDAMFLLGLEYGLKLAAAKDGAR